MLLLEGHEVRETEEHVLDGAAESENADREVRQTESRKERGREEDVVLRDAQQTRAAVFIQQHGGNADGFRDLHATVEHRVKHR